MPLKPFVRGDSYFAYLMFLNRTLVTRKQGLIIKAKPAFL